MQADEWVDANVASLAGRAFVVTGATSGIGLEACRQLARRGADVVVTARDDVRGRSAVDFIRKAAPDAKVSLRALDLASLASIRAFAARIERLDVLVDNAGVMAIPRALTADGFEMQLGTNHLGHFALTGLLLDRLPADGRVVIVSSIVHHRGVLAFDDLMGVREYTPRTAYAQSKLANLLFCHELARRLAARGSTIRAVACHPGYSATNLQQVGPRLSGSRLMATIMAMGGALLAQSAAMGALPTLAAATAPDARSGDFYGPSGPLELRGLPRKVRSNPKALDEDVARRLWTVSEELTGVKWLT